MKLSVCIDAVFGEMDIGQAICAVKNYGIHAVEFWACENKDINKIKKVADENGIEISTFCTDFLSLVDPVKRRDYLDALKRNIERAKIFGCKKIISQVGEEMAGSRKTQHDNIVQGLKECVPMLEQNGITLMIEPLNVRVDHTGYYLWSSEEAVEIIKEVGSNQVKMIYDI